MSNDYSETQKFSNFEKENKDMKKAVVLSVYKALQEKGYNPVNQIVGYIISGDPTYITAHNNARANISKIERDELLEEFVDFYVKGNSN